MSKLEISKVDKSRKQVKTKRAKTGGRSVGTPNKVSASMKERIKQFIESEFDGVVTDFNALEPKDKVQLFEKFLAYVLPRQRETAADVTVNTQSLMNEMSREEITAEIERIQKNRNDK